MSIGNVVVETPDEPDADALGISIVIGVYRCPACGEPNIVRYVWSDAVGDALKYQRLYPTVRDNTSLPPKVRERLEAASKVKKLDPSLYAVGIRRTLETVCNERGGEGGDLFDMLFDLKEKGLIPGPLADAAHQLRILGNFGAHDEVVEVSGDDVPLIEDLADAVLEFVYRAPAKVAIVEKGLKERKRAATSSDPPPDGTVTSE